VSDAHQRELAYHEKLYSGFAQSHFARPAVRAPSGPIGNDLGPPIAAGPGPQFDYSTRGAAR